MKRIYYSDWGPRYQRGFRGHAEAWWVRGDSSAPVNENFGTLRISEHLYWGLFHLGIIDALRALPNDSFIDTYEEGILFSVGLADAANLLRNSTENLTEKYDWLCSTQIIPENIEYRILVDSKQLIKELQKLADFISQGASQGYDLQLWL